jgi:MFS-type transporter involved in bile tolerance (Atg22 family)
MDIFGKFACVIGPALYELFYGITGKPCFGILSIILLFIIGFAFLTTGRKHFRIVEHKEIAE